MSIIIAFALAFVFRGFVVEAFVIPTGSMAPTLLGQHTRHHDPATGSDWTVGATQGQSSSVLNPVQRNLALHDPASGALVTKSESPTRAGDRILVLKYLYSVFEPRRFDVVVFKNPSSRPGPGVGAAQKPEETVPNAGPAENYIKRLIGLPGEHIALVDGDVFVRAATPEERAAGSASVKDTADYWSLPGWKIARKGLVEQRALWQTVFDSSYAPIPTPTTFVCPWVGVGGAAGEGGGGGGGGGGWDMSNPRVYEFKGTGESSLVYDGTRVRYADAAGSASWEINDRYAYDELPAGQGGQDDYFPVSDVRVRAGVEPLAPGARVVVSLSARGHDFECEIEGTTVTVRMRRPRGESGLSSPWETLSTGTAPALEAGKVTNVEFWHADQAIRVFVDDRVVVGPVEYDWSPAERVQYATGRPLSAWVEEQGRRGLVTNVLANERIYSPAQVSWRFRGPVRLYRVGVDRDIYYRASEAPYRLPALGTSPFSPLVLKDKQYFCCGDNSPASLDGRLWGYPEPWVRDEFGADPGVVPGDLLLGRAFFVYWPSLIKERGPLPMPDFGRMRFIW